MARVYRDQPGAGDPVRDLGKLNVQTQRLTHDGVGLMLGLARKEAQRDGPIANLCPDVIP